MVSQAWKSLLPIALLTSVAAADQCAGGEWDVIVVGMQPHRVRIEQVTNSVKVPDQPAS
jgi:hypothetical protein